MEKGEFSKDNKEITEYMLKVGKLDNAEQILNKYKETELNLKTEDDFENEMRAIVSHSQANTLNYIQTFTFLQHINMLGEMDGSKLKVLEGSSSTFRTATKHLDNEYSTRLLVKTSIIYVKKINLMKSQYY